MSVFMKQVAGTRASVTVSSVLAQGFFKCSEAEARGGSGGQWQGGGMRAALVAGCSRGIREA